MKEPSTVEPHTLTHDTSTGEKSRICAAYPSLVEPNTSLICSPSKLQDESEIDPRAGGSRPSHDMVPTRAPLASTDVELTANDYSKRLSSDTSKITDGKIDNPGVKIHTQEQQNPTPPAPTKLESACLMGMSWLTCSNVFFYVVNLFITMTSMLGWYGATNTELSEKYQTFVTPAGAAFSIWGAIFVAEGIFTIYIMFPSQRRNNPLTDRISVYWVLAQMFQIAWTFCFSADFLWGSLICMYGIYASLAVVLVRLDVGRGMAEASRWIEHRDRIHVSILHWWIYYFGFQLHFGWITCASIVNTNVMFRAYGLVLKDQVGLAIVSLALAMLSACFWVYSRRDCTHSFVVAWAVFHLANQLSNPKNPLPYEAAGTPVAESLALACYVISALALVISISSLLMHVYLVILGRNQSVGMADEGAQALSTENAVVKEDNHV